MGLEISRSLHDRLLTEAGASPGREVCGLLFGTPERIEMARACHNVAADPSRTFEIDPQTLIAAHRAARAGGPQVVGCYHSHPHGAAMPSARDAAAAAGDGALWIILGDGALTAWRATCDGFADVGLTIAP